MRPVPPKMHARAAGGGGEVMNLVLRIAGILLAILGLAIVLMTFFSPGWLIEGLTLEIGTLLLIGGVLVIGLSMAVSAIDNLRIFLAGEDPMSQAPSTSVKTTQAGIPSAGAAARSPANSPEISGHIDRSTPALRPLNADGPHFADERSLGSQALARAQLDRVAEEVREAAAEMESAQDIVSEEELYVVDERMIAGKQARILSDGTVEAETDEGWMRFENVDHLEEYMEAVRRQRGI